MTRRWPIAGVVFGVLWVFVRGPKFTAAAFLGQFLFGLAVGFPVAFVFRRLYDDTFELRRTVSTLPAVAGFLAVFAREVVVANVDVARRVMLPGMPLEPEVILVPLRVETDLGITTIANSITITPGTVTLDHDPEQNALYVHSIQGSDLESVVEPIRAWERYALTIFDEERSPEDPAPPIRNTPEDGPPEPQRAPMMPGGLLGGDQVRVDDETPEDEGALESGSNDDDEGGTDDGR
ncbi:Na+/H+ antiporter subunit E [Haloarcula nitratireducens]|uniref:Na+/H+ antiporter subunit E n=1 Tax=Haloarcula nitratireducens TaxID=2487749 RepID=A0AAW4PDG8_9EURY|nr:Na+/H+ antiporter subunit E [Halomicroarcula nitratireducens]MBX0295879.1 Na+/H+ antiporter subunit E [Halomicroarcula nitratireducens]